MSSSGYPPWDGGRDTGAASVPSPPPGPFSAGSWGPTPGVRIDHRSARGLAIAVVVLLSIMAVLCAARVGAHLNRASVVGEMNEGSFTFADVGDAEDADDVVAVAAALFLLGMVPTGILFVIWQFRHGKNARALSFRSDGLGPGWAIGGWFIPIGNLFLPAMQIYGASRESDPSLPPRPGPRRGAGSTVVVFWAVLYGLGAILDRVGSTSYPEEGDVLRDGGIDSFVSDAVSADRIMAVGSLVWVAAAIFGAVMVWRLTIRQDERAEVVLAGFSSPRPPRPDTDYWTASQPGWTGAPASPAAGVPQGGGAGRWSAPAAPGPGAWSATAAPSPGTWSAPADRPPPPAAPPPPPGGAANPPADAPNPWAPPGDVR